VSNGGGKVQDEKPTPTSAAAAALLPYDLFVHMVAIAAHSAVIVSLKHLGPRDFTTHPTAFGDHENVQDITLENEFLRRRKHILASVDHQLGDPECRPFQPPCVNELLKKVIATVFDWISWVCSWHRDFSCYGQPEA
jgi:hypothetical protein